MFLEISHEALSAVRVGVTSVHEAMHENIVQTIFFSDIQEFVVVVERTVYAAG